MKKHLQVDDPLLKIFKAFHKALSKLDMCPEVMDHFAYFYAITSVIVSSDHSKAVIYLDNSYKVTFYPFRTPQVGAKITNFEISESNYQQMLFPAFPLTLVPLVQTM